MVGGRLRGCLHAIKLSSKVRNSEDAVARSVPVLQTDRGTCARGRAA